MNNLNTSQDQIQTSPLNKSKAKSLVIFWMRMVGYIAANCIVPIAVFATKFGDRKSVV